MYCRLINKKRKNKYCTFKNCENCVYFYEFKEKNINDNKRVDQMFDRLKGKEKYL
jgi:cell fate (sporulation/competence/biofilm development) regulator YmcA (YheA/YmcA/DUF963 family)